MGRWDESLKSIRRAAELDPLSPSIASDLGVTLLFARRWDEAIAQFEKTLGLDPGFYVARYHLGQALHSSGRPERGSSESTSGAVSRPMIPGFRPCSLARSRPPAVATRQFATATNCLPSCDPALCPERGHGHHSRRAG